MQKAMNEVAEGHSTERNPCKRVTKTRAWEMIATRRQAIMLEHAISDVFDTRPVLEVDTKFILGEVCLQEWKVQGTSPMP